MATHHLIIFVKNPIAGTVKTRIAQTVGNEKAVEVYRHLVRYTQQIIRYGHWHKVVYYADFVNPSDGWNDYEKAMQAGRDLGERMANAFRERFAAGAEKVVIIGSDCLTITQEHFFAAFQALDQADVVIGPTTDGGYYLLGMKQLHKQLFENMPWSQPELRLLTEQAIRQQNLTFVLLEELTDIDEWSDYEAAMKATNSHL